MVAARRDEEAVLSGPSPTGAATRSATEAARDVRTSPWTPRAGPSRALPWTTRCLIAFVTLVARRLGVLGAQRPEPAEAGLFLLWSARRAVDGGGFPTLPEPPRHERHRHALCVVRARAVLLPPHWSLLTPVLLVALTQWRVQRIDTYKRVYSAAAIGVAHSVARHGLPPPGRARRRDGPARWPRGRTVLAVSAAAVLAKAVNTAAHRPGRQERPTPSRAGATSSSSATGTCERHRRSAPGSWSPSPSRSARGWCPSRSRRCWCCSAGCSTRSCTPPRAPTPTGLLNAGAWEHDIETALVTVTGAACRPGPARRHRHFRARRRPLPPRGRRRRAARRPSLGGWRRLDLPSRFAGTGRPPAARLRPTRRRWSLADAARARSGPPGGHRGRRDARGLEALRALGCRDAQPVSSPSARGAAGQRSAAGRRRSPDRPATAAGPAGACDRGRGRRPEGAGPGAAVCAAGGSDTPRPRRRGAGGRLRRVRGAAPARPGPRLGAGRGSRTTARTSEARPTARRDGSDGVGSGEDSGWRVRSPPARTTDPAGRRPRSRHGRGQTSSAKARNDDGQPDGRAAGTVHARPDGSAVSSPAPTCRPSARSAMTARSRRSRPTSNCLPGRVRATMRTLSWSTSQALDAHDRRLVEQQRAQAGIGVGLLARPCAGRR